MTIAVRTLKAFINLETPEEFIEGHYWAPDARGFKLVPSDVRCPFCSDWMEAVEAPIFGRICQEQGKRSATVAPALVEVLPASHEALQCTGCEIVLTRLREAEQWRAFADIP